MKQKDIQRQFINALQSEGIKLTQQRQAIFSNIMNSKGHRGYDDIQDSLLEDGMNISRATIYRTLEILVNYNLIRKLVIGNKKARYEKKIGRNHHDHMICIETGNIIEFENEEIEKLQDKEAEKYGYEIVKHVHQLFVKPIKELKTSSKEEISDKITSLAKKLNKK